MVFWVQLLPPKLQTRLGKVIVPQPTSNPGNLPNKKTDAVVYLRVSTEEQIDKFSLDTQGVAYGDPRLHCSELLYA